MPVPAIDCASLQRKLEHGDEFLLVDALPPMSYAHSHLPGAINLPPERVNVATTKRIAKDAEIVVYCANPECESSVETAERLVALGFTNVLHYPGGKNEWRESELPLERARAPYRP